MAVKTANVTARIQPEIKEHAEAILEKLGIPVSVFIDMYGISYAKTFKFTKLIIPIINIKIKIFLLLSTNLINYFTSNPSFIFYF